MKYIRILLVFLLMLISVPVYAEDEKPEEEINYDVLFSELLDSNDYEYIMNEINSIKEINHYFYNEISSENLLRFRVLELESKLNRESHEDYPITRINLKESARNLTKSSINYNFDGFVGGVLKQGDGVNYDTEFRYIYDGDGRLRMSGHQLNGTHVMSNGYSYWGADGGSEWRFPTDTNRIVEWIPNYGTYLGIPVGREMIIEILDKAGSVSFGSVNLGGTNPSIYLENAKQVAISLKFYKDVDRNNHMTNGNLVNLNSDADVILYGADGLTNQSSENGTQEYFGPANDNIPLYSRQNPNDIGTDNINGRTIYYNKVDKQNIKIFADVKGLSEAKAIFGIRGDFNRDPTMHFYVGLDIYKGSYPADVIGYVLNVDPNGGNYSGKSTYEGKEGDIVSIPVPTKANHKFTGWQIIKGVGTLGNNSFKFAGSDATIKANYELAEFNINYVLNGGTNHKDNPSKYVTGNKIIIKDPTRNNYEFLGWKEGNIIPENATGDKTFTANWKAIEYPINYILNGGANHKDNPSKYTVEDEINIKDPTRNGYTFTGWKEGNRIPKGSTGNKTFTANWKAIEYPINYILNGGTNHKDNPSKYVTGNKITIKDPTRNYYEFLGWKEGNIIPENATGDKTFTANWKAIEYPINYILNGGTNHKDNPSKYTVEDEINIKEPTRNGYTFTGWKEGSKISKGSTGNKTFTAEWKINDYKINYVLNGGTNNKDNPNKYTINDEINILDPSRTGYEFIGWKEGNKIPKGSTGDKTFTAEWKIIDYLIAYNLYGDYVEKDNIPNNDPKNPNKYTVEDEIDILDPNRNHYEFINWKEGNRINKGTSGNKIFTAVWDPIKYPIKYILNGGNNHPDNPDTYTWFDEIEIEDASREGYAFSGWKEGDYIPLHSEGEKIKTAKWKIIVYDIIYHLKGGTNHKDNPNNYTVEDEIDILDASKEGYDFLGWLEGNRIEKGSTGTKEFTASYKLHDYLITYVLNGGTNHKDNPNKYTINDDIKIKDATKEGYKFLGWKEGNRIKKGSTGNKTFTAEYQAIDYDINYRLDGGKNNPKNPNKYTIEEEINILDPTKEGYDFLGWKEGNKIPKGSTGKKVFTAEWKAIEYKINYVLDGGKNHKDNPDKYTINDDIKIKEPIKEGYDFLGWKEGNRIKKGSTGDKTFTAEWKIKEYDIDYELGGGTNNPKNPNKYTVEDEIDILDPNKEGYEFIGWKPTNKIEKGSTGKKKFTAEWKPIIYNIEYELEGGENDPNNPSSYTIEDEFEILKPKRPGFIFDGWKPTNKIEKGSTGDKTFRASWIKISYVVVDTKVK